MVQIILVRVKKQVYSYLFESLKLTAHQVNEVLHIAGKTLKDLINEEEKAGNIEGTLEDLIGEGFLDLFRTPFAFKFRERLSQQFERHASVEKDKTDLLVLIILPYMLSELAKDLKKDIDAGKSPQLLSLVGINN